MTHATDRAGNQVAYERYVAAVEHERHRRARRIAAREIRASFAAVHPL
ncbi:hypothetical protein [Amycolatopsis vastitatis]|nr:hypothetical protein [Amycolatopsis vastitatis]